MGIPLINIPMKLLASLICLCWPIYLCELMPPSHAYEARNFLLSKSNYLSSFSVHQASSSSFHTVHIEAPSTPKFKGQMQRFTSGLQLLPALGKQLHLVLCFFSVCQTIADINFHLNRHNFRR